MVNCVASIVEKTQHACYEVIIIDNNSEPDFEDIIKANLPEDKKDIFRFIALPQNIGFGRANNEGIKIARGRNILFLNPDTLLINDAISILSEFLDNTLDAGACGGNLFDESLQPAQSFRRFLPGPLWELDELLNARIQPLVYGRNKKFNHSDKPLKVGFISGADLMVKKPVINKTGGFRDDFFMYFEETDLCYRIHKEGWEIYSVPQAKIQHLEGKSMTGNDELPSDFKTMHMELGKIIYYDKNMKGFKRFLSKNIYFFFLNSRILLLRTEEKKNFYKTRKNYWEKH